ncbi:MAG: hydroxymethylbilane synthase [Armatimonadota bacterium]
MSILIGTRGSRLALAQAEWVADRLRELGASVELKVVRTQGDADAKARAEMGTGVFVKEIEEALRRGEVSLAVHSLKDLPTGTRDGLTLAAVPEREDPSDALVTRDRATLSGLSPGGRVGTGSARRIAQLRAARPDLSFLPIRGNVDTRLRKLDQDDYDALVLASAGLVRLGLEARIAQRLPFDICLPAPGQGALALQAREDDPEMATFVSQLDHAPSRAAVSAERAFLEQLGGGCAIPVGALAEVDGERMFLDGVVAGQDGEVLLRERREGPASSPQALGAELAQQLLAMGADRLVARC